MTNPIRVILPVDLVRELVQDGTAENVDDFDVMTWAIGGPALTDLVVLVGAIGNSFQVADSAALHALLHKVAAWINGGHRPDPESPNNDWILHVESPRGNLNVTLPDSPTAGEKLVEIAGVILRSDNERSE